MDINDKIHVTYLLGMQNRAQNTHILISFVLKNGKV